MPRFMPQSPAHRRYLRRLMIAMALYVVTIMLAAFTLHHRAPLGVLTVLLALLPGAAMIGSIWAMGRLLVEIEDEYLRLLEVRQMMVGTAFALAVCSTWGALEIFADVPVLPVFWVYPLWCLGLGLGAVWNVLDLRCQQPEGGE